MKSILDRSFHYTPSAQTDLRKTFARLRREQREQVETGVTRTQALAAAESKVVSMSLSRTARPDFIWLALRKP